MKVAGIDITNPDKKIARGITKQEVVAYYATIASSFLSYAKGRPLSLIRCHQGIEQACFFKKHPVTSEEKKHSFLYKQEEYFCLMNQKDVIYQVQMGTIEFHCWVCHKKNLDHPDAMIFDLDPGEKVTLTQLRQGVEHLKEILDELHLVSFLKTSGGKGYHVVVPFSKVKNWEKFEMFAKRVAQLMEKRYPHLYTTNMRKKERKGRIFIDYLRNKKGATCVAPFSLRARKHLPISMPIAWDALYDIAPHEITIKNYPQYLKKDIWKEFYIVKQLLK